MDAYTVKVLFARLTTTPGLIRGLSTSDRDALATTYGHDWRDRLREARTRVAAS